MASGRSGLLRTDLNGFGGVPNRKPDFEDPVLHAGDGMVGVYV